MSYNLIQVVRLDSAPKFGSSYNALDVTEARELTLRLVCRDSVTAPGSATHNYHINIILITAIKYVCLSLKFERSFHFYFWVVGFTESG
jgi:hypothetical protein